MAFLLWVRTLFLWWGVLKEELKPLFLLQLKIMKDTKIKQLQALINSNNKIFTIHKLLQLLEISKKDIQKMEKKDKKLYTELKKQCEVLVANLYELIVERPRQATQYLQLANQQEQFFNTIFGESTENITMPDIVIKREKSSTNINIIETTKK